MEKNLNATEVRVLGALIEKEMATPEYYPLTLNSLTAACNQKSNRDPVTALAEEEIVRALNSLKMKQVVVQSAEGTRALKYRHILSERMGLEPAELAVLAELLLRGPQTLAELRTRADRMHPVPDMEAIEAIAAELVERDLAVRLPRQPGRKESRYAHLLSGDPVAMDEERVVPPEAARRRVMAEDERMARLEEEVATLKTEIAALRALLDEFRGQFE